MIDTDVETGMFFPPPMRIVQHGDSIRVLYPISGPEIAEYLEPLPDSERIDRGVLSSDIAEARVNINRAYNLRWHAEQGELMPFTQHMKRRHHAR
jgi:hypothetical protein